jgi:hypothetical protein
MNEKIEKIQQIKQKYNFNWEAIVGLIILMSTILGSTVPLYLHSSTQIDAIHQEIRAVNQEMKDFHGRLERQDAEFKGHVLLMEERNRK